MSLRVSNVTEEERLHIFNSVYLCATVDNLSKYNFHFINKNMFYTLDTEYVNKIIEADQFYFLWSYAKAGRDIPIKKTYSRKMEKTLGR